MNLKNKIIPKSDFQYSVNIDFDLNSDEKIKGYIPTVGGLNIIEDIMLSTIPTSKTRFQQTASCARKQNFPICCYFVLFSTFVAPIEEPKQHL